MGPARPERRPAAPLPSTGTPSTAAACRSGGGIYTVEGTIGQPDADPLQPATGGSFEVSGGFWPGLVAAAPRPDPLFADGFE